MYQMKSTVSEACENHAGSEATNAHASDDLDHGLTGACGLLPAFHGSCPQSGIQVA
jgi:hypothetical protein